MGYKCLYKKTTNRGEFNRAYKYHLEHSGKIHCSYCGYHRGENDERKFYSIDTRTDGRFDTRYPNWKLVSKNKKQWMKKPIKMKVNYYGGYRNTYTRITW